MAGVGRGSLAGVGRGSLAGVAGQGQSAVRLVIEAPDAETVRRLLLDLVGHSQTVEDSVGPLLAPVDAQPEQAPAPRPPDSSHVAWAKLREAWLTECGLPASKCSALDNRAWLDLCSRPDAPPIDTLLVVLRREAPKWHSRAAKAKDAGELDPWAGVPSVRTWLARRPWELAPDPAPRDPREKPPVPPAVAGYVSDLRQKADTASKRGDHSLARDYRQLVSQALTTGALP